MFVLTIIGIILLVLAIINWGQSEGFFQRLGKILRGESSFEEQVHHTFVTNNGSVAIMENDDFEDYAFDDDSDYVFTEEDGE